MAYPVSDKFKAALSGSHVAITKIDICDPLTDQVLYTLNTITEGEVTEDRAQTSRRRGSFTAIDETGVLTPTDARDLLAPYGNEFRPYKGIVLPDGTTELVPQGVLGIDISDITDSGENLSIKCQGSDRSSRIARAIFRDTLSVAKGTVSTDVAMAILNAIGYGGPTMLMADASVPIAQKTFNIGDDPWTALVEVFANCACQTYFDATGILIAQALPDYDNLPVSWNIQEGSSGNLLAIQRQMQRDDTIANWYIVTGEHPSNTTAIPFGQAYDSNPNSPTYVNGKYGIVVKHVVANGVLTDLDAAKMAAHLLATRLGLAEQDQFTIVPNSAMQVDDIALVNRTNSKMTNVRVVVDQVTHPLVANRSGEAITRRRLIA